MYSAPVACFALELGWMDDKNMEMLCIGKLAKEIAIASEGWGPLDITSCEYTMEIAKIWSGMRIRTVESLKTLTRAAPGTAYAGLNQEGLHP